MGLLTNLLTLPVTGPLRGALWIARQVARAAEEEGGNPRALRERLAALECALEAGEIDETAFEVEEAKILSMLASATGRSDP